MDCALAALTAARRRAFISGSGAPILAATVISRLSLENIAERFLSCAPLRYMMFLYLLWPAIAAHAFLLRLHAALAAAHARFNRRRSLLLRSGFAPKRAPDPAVRPGRRARRQGCG